MKRKVEDVPSAGGTLRLGAAENPRMEGVQHRSVAEQKGQRLVLIPLPGINPQPLRVRPNCLLYVAADTIVSAQNARHGRDADFGSRRDLAQAYFAPAGNGFAGSVTGVFFDHDHSPWFSRGRSGERHNVAGYCCAA
jgi:hypothetical protein